MPSVHVNIKTFANTGEDVKPWQLYEIFIKMLVALELIKHQQTDEIRSSISDIALTNRSEDMVAALQKVTEEFLLAHVTHTHEFLKWFKEKYFLEVARQRDLGNSTRVNQSVNATRTDNWKNKYGGKVQ